MHPFITFISFIVLNFLLHLPFSFSTDDYRYTDCLKPFNCGRITNITFPFWGRDRPNYCGLPGYELRCEDDDDDRIELVTETSSYRVLNFSNTDQRVHIVPVDTSTDSCPAPSVNVSFPAGIFTYPFPNPVNITLFYDCPTIPWFAAAYTYRCSQNETLSTTNYFWIGPFTGIPPAAVAAAWGCNDIVSVPILQTLADSDMSDPSMSQQVLREGFEVNYTTDSTNCTSCQGSGGHCGYNYTTYQPMCFCSDKEYPGRCLAKPGTNVAVKLAIGLGVGFGGIILTCIIFFLYQRRKKNIFSKKSSNLISRDISDHSLKPDIENGSIYFQTPIFTYKELDEATNHFDTNKEVGDGGFGTVYHGKLRDGRIVAVKRLFEHNYKRVEQFMNEIAILSRLRHQNLVSLYGCTSQHSRELLLVYEYVPNGTVADHIHGERAKAGLLTWPIRMSIAIESADALAYLHASDIIHRDVKTNNILIDNGFHVKVADFGLSRLFPNDVSHVSTAPQGTPGYVDPEYYQCYQLNDKSDVYSFGVVLIELISSKPAVDIGRHRHEVNLASLAINKITNRALHELVDPSLGFETDYTTRNMITSVAELAFRCLQQEKEMRPCMVEVVEVLRGIESEDYRKKTDELDISADISLLKNIEPLSPVSVTDKWASKSSTPNTSGGGIM